MSVISVALAKADLRVIHSSDDGLLQIHLDAAEDEARRYMNRDELPMVGDATTSEDMSEPVPNSEAQVAPSVVSAVLLLVRAKYEAETGTEISALRRAAEDLLQPYRIGLGV